MLYCSTVRQQHHTGHHLQLPSSQSPQNWMHGAPTISPQLQTACTHQCPPSLKMYVHHNCAIPIPFSTSSTTAGAINQLITQDPTPPIPLQAQPPSMPVFKQTAHQVRSAPANSFCSTKVRALFQVLDPPMPHPFSPSPFRQFISWIQEPDHICRTHPQHFIPTS